MSNKFKKFNDLLADKLSYSLATMLMFYVILALVLVPLFYNQPTSLVGWAAYICSVIFQGIALPVLGYTAKKSGDKTDLAISEILKLSEEIKKIVKVVEQKEEHICEDVDKIIQLENKELEDLNNEKAS